MKSVPANDTDEDGGTRLRVLSHEEIAERSFLSLCLGNPGEARRYLQLMTDAHFTTEPARASFNWVKDRVELKKPGSEVDTSRLPMDHAARELLPELIIRSQTESAAPEALPEYYFRLCESELSRRISAVKSTIADAGDGDAGLRELYHLEARRRDILKVIQEGTYENA